MLEFLLRILISPIFLGVLLFEFVMSGLVLLVIYLFTGINISDILFTNINFLDVKVITALIINNVLFIIILFLKIFAELFNDTIRRRSVSSELISVIKIWIFAIPIFITVPPYLIYVIFFKKDKLK